MILNSGSRIGRYGIRSLLGSGGMGDVYLAYDMELEREIAVKVLRDQEGNGERSRRFVAVLRARSPRTLRAGVASRARHAGSSQRG